MAIETVSFAQIATAATANGAVLYGLTVGGAVYEYNYSREVWIPVSTNEPRRTDLRVSTLNQASTMVSHEAPVGVK